MAYDKAADDNESHRLLNKAGIRPVIQNRRLWKDQIEQMLPGHDGRSNIVYDEAGTVYCYNRTSLPMVRQKMAYIGYEPQRETIKYRCPARHEGWPCPHDEVCNTGKSYGKTVRVDRTIDLRRFPPIPRATKKFERLYDGRTSVERVNARLKIFWGVDDGNLVGARRFHAMVGAVLVVHVAFATLLAQAPRREGTLGKLRLGPIQKALRNTPPPDRPKTRHHDGRGAGNMRHFALQPLWPLSFRRCIPEPPPLEDVPRCLVVAVRYSHARQRKRLGRSCLGGTAGRSCALLS